MAGTSLPVAVIGRPLRVTLAIALVIVLLAIVVVIVLAVLLVVVVPAILLVVVIAILVLIARRRVVAAIPMLPALVLLLLAGGLAGSVHGNRGGNRRGAALDGSRYRRRIGHFRANRRRHVVAAAILALGIRHFLNVAFPETMLERGALYHHGVAAIVFPVMVLVLRRVCWCIDSKTTTCSGYRKGCCRRL